MQEQHGPIDLLKHKQSNPTLQKQLPQQTSPN